MTIDVTATETDTSTVALVEVYNRCNNSNRATVRVLVAGGAAAFVDFEDVMSGFTGDQYADRGVVFSSSAQLMVVQMDDSLGLRSLCGTTDGSACDAEIRMRFEPPVSFVSFYVGDREFGFEDPFSIEVTNTAGAIVGRVRSRYDRRFYDFGAPRIRQLLFSASSDLELVDNILFEPESN